jgi:hypothetical protein
MSHSAIAAIWMSGTNEDAAADKQSVHIVNFRVWLSQLKKGIENCMKIFNHTGKTENTSEKSISKFIYLCRKM